MDLHINQPFFVRLEDGFVVAYIQPPMMNHPYPQVTDGSLNAELKVISELYDRLNGVEDMGCFYVKVGQHISTSGTSFVLGGANAVNGEWRTPHPGPQPGPPPAQPIRPFPPVSQATMQQWDFQASQGNFGQWNLEQRTYNQWRKFEHDTDLHARQVQTWQLRYAEHKRWLDLLDNHLRPHISLVIGSKTNRQQYTLGFHLYSRNDDPRQGLETYTFVQHSNPVSLLNRSQLIKQALNFFVGQVNSEIFI
ncbi:hypothetical protein C8R43DRAFT_946252 [Mycena crocata]|nr:hypothetical protein C8R43DRAFT_946252 [Mycena crocata]